MSPNISTHDDFSNVEYVFEGRYTIVLDFSHVDDTVVSFDFSYDDKNSID